MSAQASRKYKILLRPLFDAMIAEAVKHDTEKGDTWMILDKERMDDVVEQAHSNNGRGSLVVSMNDPEGHQDVDIALVRGFRWLRSYYKRKGFWP